MEVRHIIHEKRVEKCHLEVVVFISTQIEEVEDIPHGITTRGTKSHPYTSKSFPQDCHHLAYLV